MLELSLRARPTLCANGASISTALGWDHFRQVSPHDERRRNGAANVGGVRLAFRDALAPFVLTLPCACFALAFAFARPANRAG